MNFSDVSEVALGFCPARGSLLTLHRKGSVPDATHLRK